MIFSKPIKRGVEGLRDATFNINPARETKYISSHIESEILIPTATGILLVFRSSLDRVSFSHSLFLYFPLRSVSSNVTTLSDLLHLAAESDIGFKPRPSK